MRIWMFGAALCALTVSPALAQSWQEFDYPDTNIMLTFPGAPTVGSGTYTTGGVSLPETTYTLKQTGRVFEMEVVDFSSTNISKADAIKAAVTAWSAKGEVLEDTFARIDNDFGRNLNVTQKDGSRSVGSLYFLNRKLYVIQGISLKNDPDPQSGQPTRFRESLSFITGSPAPRGGGRGAGGRRGAAPAGGGAPADGAAPPN